MSRSRASMPPTRTAPRCGRPSRSSRRTMVDLPAPLGPTIPTRSPAAMRNAQALMRRTLGRVRERRRRRIRWWAPGARASARCGGHRHGSWRSIPHPSMRGCWSRPTGPACPGARSRANRAGAEKPPCRPSARSAAPRRSSSPAGHPPGAQRQRQRSAQRDAQVADAAREQADRQHPQGAVRQAARARASCSCLPQDFPGRRP